MKINFNSQQSFSGYKNVLALNAADPARNTAFMTMQLNNEGKHDLDEFRKIKSMMNLPQQDIQNDVLSLFYVNDGNKSGYFMLDKNRLMSGEELLGLERNLSKTEYKPIENWTTKAYTFLADLTKRMSNDSIGTYHDGDMVKVMRSWLDVLKNIISDEKSAIDIFNYTAAKNHPFQETAGVLNRAITKTMKVFFGF